MQKARRVLVVVAQLGRRSIEREMTMSAKEEGARFDRGNNRDVFVRFATEERRVTRYFLNNNRFFCSFLSFFSALFILGRQAMMYERRQHSPFLESSVEEGKDPLRGGRVAVGVDASKGGSSYEGLARLARGLGVLFVAEGDDGGGLLLGVVVVLEGLELDFREEAAARASLPSAGVLVARLVEIVLTLAGDLAEGLELRPGLAPLDDALVLLRVHVGRPLPLGLPPRVGRLLEVLPGVGQLPAVWLPQRRMVLLEALVVGRVLLLLLPLVDTTATREVLRLRRVTTILRMVLLGEGHVVAQEAAAAQGVLGGALVVRHGQGRQHRRGVTVH